MQLPTVDYLRELKPSDHVALTHSTDRILYLTAAAAGIRDQVEAVLKEGVDSLNFVGYGTQAQCYEQGGILYKLTAPEKLAERDRALVDRASVVRRDLEAVLKCYSELDRLNIAHPKFYGVELKKVDGRWQEVQIMEYINGPSLQDVMEYDNDPNTSAFYKLNRPANEGDQYDQLVVAKFAAVQALAEKLTGGYVVQLKRKAMDTLAEIRKMQASGSIKTPPTACFAKKTGDLSWL
ncbi:hypothetical protein IPJ72_05105 [Candidatus Peregrinibacteria bacterium]|nr:MAG: hypothetical protein IPJ72_05105 [Candidatus Peregrinibacteria bacterium]